MDLSPYIIYKDFKNGRINKKRALDLLISLIENDLEHQEKTRILAIKFLGLLHPKEKRIFDFIENILISDLNEYMREQAANILIRYYPDRAAKPIAWVLKNEKESDFTCSLIKSIEKTASDYLKSVLKIKKYVNFHGSIIFTSDSEKLINLNSKNINKIDEIKNLDGLTDLKKIYLNYNQISEIKGLEKNTNLRSLHLQGNKIIKIGDLSHLKKLEYLYLNNNEISKIEGITDLKNLKSFIIYDNYISKIENLENLSNLEVLNLRNNHISEINGLESLSNLKRLDLSNNKLLEIKGVENLTKLEFLDLSHNEINKVKGLENLRKLKFLDLRNNKIQNIKGLEELKKLQHLYIGFNPIIDDINIDLLNHIKVLDIKNTEGLFIPEKIWNVYPDESKLREELFLNQNKIRDIKFIYEKFDSQSILREMSKKRNPLEFFTNSSWMVIWKNNEYELFRLSILGDIKWIQRSKKVHIH
ncbi:MAG: leucine-rich repeat domain-containing protein [Promethearchaeota archaeon]